MEVQVNLMAVLAATAASMIVGAAWYSKSLFGEKWAQLARVKMATRKSESWRPMLTALLLSFVTAYVLAYFTYLFNYFFQNSYFQDALMTAFWLWLGFTAARIMMHDTFEGRPRLLTWLTIGHELSAVLIMALIIGILGY